MVTVNPHNVEPEDTIRVRRSTLVLVVLVLVAFAAGLGTGFALWGNQGAQAAGAPESLADTLPTQAPQRLSVPAEGPAYGPADAKVTIIEFSDFQCPFCRQWFSTVWTQLKTAYAGQIRLVYRDFPLYDIHPDAEAAAEAAHCALEQNQYWPYHDLLFSSQSLGTDVYLSYAAKLNLDQAKFKDCLASGKYKQEISTDAQYGASLGITGTPTFFINGIPLVGAQPYSVFKKIIDQELASK